MGAGIANLMVGKGLRVRLCDQIEIVLEVDRMSEGTVPVGLPSGEDGRIRNSRLARLRLVTHEHPGVPSEPLEVRREGDIFVVRREVVTIHRTCGVEKNQPGGLGGTSAGGEQKRDRESRGQPPIEDPHQPG